MERGKVCLKGGINQEQGYYDGVAWFISSLLSLIAAIASPLAETAGTVVVSQDENCVLAGHAVQLGGGKLSAQVPLALFREAAETPTAYPEPWVSLEANARPKALAQVLTDAEGSFRFSGLPEGLYQVRSIGALPSPAQSATLIQGAPCTTNIEVAVAIGTTFRGQVVDAQGQAVAGSHVFVAALEGDDSAGNMLAGQRPSPITKSDESGHFELSLVPSGTVHIQAAKRNYGYSQRSRLNAQEGALTEQLVLKLRDERSRLSQEKDRRGRIGVHLAFQPLGPVIETLVPGMPAEKAGLQPGDRIVKVEGEETNFMSAVEFLSRCRGPAGTRVRLSIRREGLPPFDLVLIRTAIDKKKLGRLLQGEGQQ